uniref:Uncharacterized protein n=1 Tax=Wuchereria bancrofti TaxID=6293 RepID=A0AAF5Q2B4_WUCBA
MNSIYYCFLFVILHVTSISTLPLITNDDYVADFTGIESTELAIAMTNVNETLLVMETINVTEPSKFISILENSKRSERNTENSETIDDSTSLSTIEEKEEYNFTTATSWNIVPLMMNVSEIKSFIDYEMIDETTTSLPIVESTKLEQQLASMSSSIASTIQPIQLPIDISDGKRVNCTQITTSCVNRKHGII